MRRGGRREPGGGTFEAGDGALAPALLAPAQRYAVANAGGKHKGKGWRVAAPVAGDGIDDGTAQALRLQGRRPRTASGQVLGTGVHTECSP